MNNQQLAVMLSFASTLDGRVPCDEAAVMAWAAVVDTDIDTSWAADFVKKHYGRTDDMLVPSALNRSWRQHRATQQAARIATSGGDRHCQRTGCPCTHSEPCYKGWIDREHESVTAPCSVCRPTVLEALKGKFQ